ncbi:MAG: cupin domain-containing protein [Gemmataceae bacterium]|nr:cupin domain-containing protein [Gemmataceae bacterium]MDW8264068.1 cupin domain-containing protein [Gemmataceae bacterium]
MTYIFRPEDGRELRDERYGSVFIFDVSERARLKNLDVALAVVDVKKRSPRHYHCQTEEVYHILEGQGRMYIEAEVEEVGPGTTIVIPRNTKHSLENTGAIPLRFLVVSSPPYDYNDDHEVDNSSSDETPA